MPKSQLTSNSCTEDECLTNVWWPWGKQQSA